MASFTPTAHVWGCTGALNAAAAVVMRTVDANAGVGVGQRELCVTSIMDSAVPGLRARPRAMPATLPVDTQRMLWMYRTLRDCVATHHEPSTSHVLTAHGAQLSNGQIHFEWPWMVADRG